MSREGGFISSSGEHITIKGFLETSLIEWEGMLASVIFLPGCNYRCPYCHSPHLVYSSEEIEVIPTAAVMESLRKKKGWIDGVVISGGEPTLHRGLREFIRMLKALGLKVKLDTNGSNPDVLEGFLKEGLLDCVAMDIKAPLEERDYNRATGVSCDVEALKRSICIIIESGVEHEFRTTVCPGLLTEEGIGRIPQYISGAKRYVLQSFRPNNCLDTDMLEVKPYSVEILKRFKEVVKDSLSNCLLRGEPADERSGYKNPDF